METIIFLIISLFVLVFLLILNNNKRKPKVSETKRKISNSPSTSDPAGSGATPQHRLKSPPNVKLDLVKVDPESRESIETFESIFNKQLQLGSSIEFSAVH